MFRSFLSRLALATIVSAGLFILPQRVQATLWYVDQAAPGPVHDGLTWCTAFLNPSQALQVVVAGDTIRVANGTYKPDPTGLANPREATFALVSGTALEGGYAGCGAPNPDERDFAFYESTLSGDLNGDDGPDYANNGENAFHVVTSDDNTPDTVFSGFTVTAGNAEVATLFPRAGASLVIRDGSPSVKDCRFVKNSSSDFGQGSAVYVSNTPSAIFANCLFADNRASGVMNSGSWANFSNCIFRSNEQSGMRINISSPTITNCLFVHNGNSGIVNVQFSDPNIINCTFAFNRASSPTGCGAGFNDGIYSFPSLRNCVFWANTDENPDTDAEEEQICGFSVYVAYSNWQGHGALPEYGNIDSDPLFIDSDGPDEIAGNEDDDFRLQSGSPCIDTGNNSSVPVDIDIDLDGNPRLLDGNEDGILTVDMGPYEARYGGTCCNGQVCLQDGIGESDCTEAHPGARWFDGRSCDDAVPCPECLTDLECNDGLFCNGLEQCDSLAGCLLGDDPCPPGLECDEAADACVVPPIPAVSGWGLLILGLALLTLAKCQSRMRPTRA